MKLEPKEIEKEILEMEKGFFVVLLLIYCKTKNNKEYLKYDF